MSVEVATEVSLEELEEIFQLPAYEPDKGYRLVALDDDVTPIKYVIMLLIQVFDYEPKKAVQLTLKIHTTGRGVVATGSRAELIKKQEIVAAYNREYNEQLFTIVEKITD